MGKEIKQFSGILNTDDSNEVLPPIQHKMAFNGRFRNGRFENVPGTRQIAHTLPAGTNVCIGGFYDELRKRIVYFLYNSNTNHQISLFDIETETIATLVLNNTDTNGDILAFDITKPILNAKVMYGDAAQGDVLYWLNSQGEPCQINIKQQLAGDYGILERSFISVIKEIPDIPPQVVYEDDATVTVNNLKKKLFKFKTRFVYNNSEKSCWSAHSFMPLPLAYGSIDQDSDPTKNADIAIVFQTGTKIVKKIEVAACYSLGNEFSKFLEVFVIDKEVEGLADNDTSIVRFYNDKAYDFIDEEESTQLFDLVPIAAGAMEILNGNAPIYGGITENYDNLSTLNTTAIVSSSTGANTTQEPAIMVVTQNGKSAFGTGSIHITVLGKISQGDVFTVFTDNGNFSYVSIIADTPAEVIIGLGAAANTAGFSTVSMDAFNIYVSKAATQLTRISTVLSSLSFSATDSSYAYDWYSVYGAGLQYLDGEGRAVGGVQTDDELSVQTIPYTESGGTLIPQFNLSIYHAPHIDAKYYHIVRTKNLSESKFLYWISDRTFKDEQTEPDNTKYAYISIENLNTFLKNNPNSPLGYDFAGGDRIRFVKLYPNGGSTTPAIEVNKDFEIQSQIIDPEINGIQHQGQFLKIVLPSVSTNFDFGIQTHSPVPTAINYFNYLIRIYTPAKSAENNLNVYYEFSERYAIGDAGLSTRFHQGQLQNQSTDLATPATFALSKGDFYYRNRTINTGVELDYQVQTSEIPEGRITVGIDFENASYDDPNILGGSAPSQDLVGFNIVFDDTRWLIKVISGTYTFRIKGSIAVDFRDFGEVYAYFLEDNVGNITYLVEPQFVDVGPKIFTFDKTFQLNAAAGARIYLFGYSVIDFHNNKIYGQSDITITRELKFSQGLIDANFSDYYASAVNSNGRAWVVEPNSARVTAGALQRWGLFYLQGTTVNQTNRFYPQNQDTIDVSKGDIKRYKLRERILRIFQQRGCAQVGVFTKFIEDSGNTNILATTDNIITTNNVQYYKGEFGVGDHPESLVSTVQSDYFVNQYTGEQCRLSGDGIIPISRLYKGEYYIKSLLAPFNKTWARPDGSNAKIIGCYNYFEGDYMCVLQGGTNGSNTIVPYTFAFNEKRNGYHDFFNIYPEWMVGAEDKMYGWLNGQLYAFDNTSAYCNFFGVQYSPSIKVVFNGNEAIKKAYLAIAYQSNQIWVSPVNGDINTSMINEQTGLQQISQLKNVDYDIQENIRYSAFLYDANSGLVAADALLEGDILNGNWIEVNFVYLGSEFAYLYLPYVTYAISQRNF